MNSEQIKVILKEEILEIAPEADLDDLDIDEDMRDELDLDSMDFLRLAINIGKRLQLQIPDADLSRVVTFEGMLAYLSEHCSE